MGNQMSMFGEEEIGAADTPPALPETLPASAVQEQAQLPETLAPPVPLQATAAPPLSALEILAPAPRPKFPTPPPREPARRGRRPLKSVAIQLDELSVPPDEELFAKQYHAAGTVAGWLGIPTPLLRNWSMEFEAVLKPRKNRKGDRLYRPEDVKMLVLIHQLLRERKYSIEGARKYLLQNPAAANAQQQIYESLTRVRAFLLALKANLGA